MSEPRTSREQFAPVATAYLTSDAHARPAEIEEILAGVVNQPGDFLDVGTGAGHVAFALSPMATSVTAYDLTPEMLAVVDLEAKRRGLENIHLCLGLAEQMPFEAGSFDGVACRVAAHHFHGVPAFVREVFRVLRPDGWFLLIDTVSPEADLADTALNHLETLRDPSHVRNLRPSEWRSLVQEAGFVFESDHLGAKRMDFDAWLDRMRVDEARRALIEPIVWSGQVLTDVIRPTDVDGTRMFELPEYVLIARKQK